MRREVVKQVDSEEAVRPVLQWAADMIRRGLPGGPVAVRIGRPTRTLDSNDKLWPMLRDISRQVEWHGQYLKDHEWKDVLTAALKGQKAVPGIEGGFVVIGAHTSKMDQQTFSDLIELAYAFGGEHGVEWSEHSKKVYAEYGDAP